MAPGCHFTHCFDAGAQPLHGEMEDGLDAWLLPPSVCRLGWHLGQYSLLLALACQLQVLSRFVRLRQSWPRLHRLGWGLSGLALATALAYGLLVGPAGRAGALAALNGSREAVLWLVQLGRLLLLAVGLRGRRPQRRLAAAYGLAYACFFGGSLNFLLNRTGVVNIHLMDPNALAWGLALELVLLSGLLTARFRQAQRQNADWRVRYLRERAAAGQRLIAAQDEGREALARELHDALAPGLTALHLAWQGRAVRQALTQGLSALTEAHVHSAALLRHDVRTLSQALLPTPPARPYPCPRPWPCSPKPSA